jgi:hypothetical protein
MTACLATAFNSKLSQNISQWANTGEAALEQVQTNECGEKQEILADEYRACFQSKG